MNEQCKLIFAIFLLVHQSAMPAKFDRAVFEQLLLKRFFFAPSFSIYGGVAGLYDYGPPGCALQANILQLWRQHFVLEEDMLELDCSIMTPAEVLKTSGHVDKFTDWMCKDTKTGEIFRADHLVEGVLEARLEGDAIARQAEQGGDALKTTVDVVKDDKGKKNKKNKQAKVTAIKLEDSVKQNYRSVLAQIDNYDGEGLAQLIEQFNIKSPETGNDLTRPTEFNLMFESSIGPTGHLKGYVYMNRASICILHNS
jgi:glycyl-tRNA synthetase